MNLSLGRTASKQEIKTLPVSLKAPEGKALKCISVRVRNCLRGGGSDSKEGEKALKNCLGRRNPCGLGAPGLPSVTGEVDCGAKSERCRQEQSAVGRLPGEGARLGWGQQGSSQLPAQTLGSKAKEPPSSEPGDGPESSGSPFQAGVIP